MVKVTEGSGMSEVDRSGLEVRVLGEYFELFLLSLRKSEAESNISISTMRALAGITKGCEWRNAVGMKGR